MVVERGDSAPALGLSDRKKVEHAEAAYIAAAFVLWCRSCVPSSLRATGVVERSAADHESEEQWQNTICHTAT